MKKGYWISLYLKVENQENLKKYAAKEAISIEEYIIKVLEGFNNVQ